MKLALFIGGVITKISKITELPLKKVETMYKEAFLD